MADYMEFDQNMSGSNRNQPVIQSKGISGWLIRNKLASSNAGAQKVLVVVFIVVLVAIALVLGLFS